MVWLEFMDFLGRTIYYQPDPPPQVRKEPMQVLAVGPPRSATESLQQALIKLGYPTFHGWDLVFEQPLRQHLWVRLAQRKWHGTPDGDVSITTADFDQLLGHVTAVTDAAGSCFAAELIAAYPDAKVILNTRTDLDAWHESVVNTLCAVEESWWIYVQTWFSAENFWSYQVYYRYLWPRFFRSPSRSVRAGVVPNGKWIYREHANMVRGLVAKDRLLEWSVEDRWEPLCKFLGKEVPTEPFPNVNNAGGFDGTVAKILRARLNTVYRNLFLTCGSLVAIGATVWRYKYATT